MFMNINLNLGKPSTSPSSPDYVPSIFKFNKSTNVENHQRLQRYKRFIGLKERSDECNQPLVANNEEHCEEVYREESNDRMKDASAQCVVQSMDQAVNTNSMDSATSTGTVKKVNESLEKCNKEIENLQEGNLSLRKEIKILKSPSAMMQGDNTQTRFYTGLPSFAVFNKLSHLFTELVCPGLTGCGLSHSDQLLLVLMKLRLSIPNQDLAYRFRIDVTKVSKVFHVWIDIMARELRQLIVWPDRGIIRENLPRCFKEKYMRTTCIIDCSEVFIERPTSLSARAETYSNYKSHNTVKFLIAISPTGAIIFVSKCWGGRVSDKYLTANSSFIDHLMHGDLVLADRGFDIADDLALVGASLAIPPFTKGKNQLSQSEVERARALSRVRIHVERAIGRLKLLYKILRSTLPISLIKRPHETDYATIDKILIVCCALCNLHPQLI